VGIRPLAQRRAAQHECADAIVRIMQRTVLDRPARLRDLQIAEHALALIVPNDGSEPQKAGRLGARRAWDGGCP
jgi:hypothetical protein